MTPETFSLSKWPRLSTWWVIALLLSVLVFLIAPQQLPVSIYKLNLIALAAVAGYWIDRSVFPYARPQLSALKALDDTVDDEPLQLTQAPGEPLDGQECVLVSLPHTAALYFMLGCMVRRAVIMAATIVAVGLGA